MTSSVDPFIGCEPTQLPPASGVAASWWAPKPLIGNTHPGATYPLGMVSVCAYSGAYPTGYGCYDLNTEGVPEQLFEANQASGFTHFQQSGTGAIRKYYNYFRVTPMVEPVSALGTSWELSGERAEPGWYAARLASGIECELTVGPRSAVHRYTFPRHDAARIVVDFSRGGLEIPFGATVPLRAGLTVLDPRAANGQITVEGVPLSVHLECAAEDWKCLLWYDNRPMPGGSRLDFDAIRPTTQRPFGLMWTGPTEAGRTVEIRLGFSLRGVQQARDNLHRDVPSVPNSFDLRRAATKQAWAEHTGLVHAEAATPDRQVIFDTAVYHSLIKPCFASSESPWWPTAGPFVFDLCTMWDIYRTQLPLLTAILPDRAMELGRALVTICEEEGNFPIGYRMARGADRFSRQGSALAHTFLADLAQAGIPGMDWDHALTHMSEDLRRDYGEEYLRFGVTEPVTHTLDLAHGYWCSARIARRVGDHALAASLEARAGGWRTAFEANGRLLKDSTFYEGTRWNYSFRLLSDMAARIGLAGGDQAFVDLLDVFFGFGAPPVTQPRQSPGPAEMTAGYALGRFQGLNNEPDMDSPWAYTYAGRPDRTADIVHGVLTNQFGAGRGGLPGNDDSGGLSSWYVWASLGLFPVAGQDLFLLNAPAHAHARLSLADEVLTIDTEGFRTPEPDRAAHYVKGMRLDGQPLERAWLTGEELRRGGHLVIELTDQPTEWGTAHRPPSDSTPSDSTRSTPTEEAP